MRRALFPSVLAISLLIPAVAAALQGFPPAGGYGQPGLQMSGPGWGSQYAADVWLEGEQSYFRRGDRLNVRFSVPRDSYVAIVHIDSDGQLDFLFPSSPWDDGFVRGGRIHSLPVRSFTSTTIWGSPGIGYLYILASASPLDFGYFRGGFGSTWDWGYAGRDVYGDPFFAFEQVTRLLLPPWSYANYVWDYHGYYVEGIHRYPGYACSDRRYDYGWGWTPSYGSCRRHEIFVRDNPYYYDTRRYAGDRRVIYRDYSRLDPRYGFKESPEPPRWGVPRDPMPAPSGGVPGGGAVPRRDPLEADRPQPAPSSDPRSVPARPAVPDRAPASSGNDGGSSTVPQRGPSVPQRAPVSEPREPAPRGAPEPPSRDAPDPGQSTEPGTRARPVPDTGTSSGDTRDAGVPARGRP